MNAMPHLAPETDDTTPDISVVIPVYLGAEWMMPCLTALAAQTLGHNRFEVIMVFNGPNDGAAEVAKQFCREHPTLRVHMLHSDRASAPHARNMGTEAALGRHITWIDCDDWVSAEYLELLFLSARPGKIPLAQIVNVSETGDLDATNLINSSILQNEEYIVSPASFPRGLSFMTCKLVPSWMAKAVPFEENLRSGEDVALFARMFALYPFEFNLIPALAGAKYFRLMRNASVSRQDANFDFLVTQRLDVISSLNQSLLACRPEAIQLVKSFINSQASFIRKYAESHPDDAELIIELLANRLFGYFPWTSWFTKVERLVIAYNFLPYADTGAIVAAKRIRAVGRPVDVVMHRMDDVRRKDVTHHSIAQPYVQFVASIDGPSAFAAYLGISEFCRRGMQAIESWIDGGRNYREIYSRAMWPASHYLAALYKVRYPDVRWVAEFSDPIQLDSNGQFRSSPVILDEISEEILAAVDEPTRSVLASNMNVYFWVEHLAYMLADELVFTNKNQMQVMSGYATEAGSTAIKSKSAIMAQPTLSQSFYHLKPSGVPLDRTKVNIGYFGEFYSTRNLDEILEALATSGVDVRARVCIHVFTSDTVAAKKALRGYGGIERLVRVSPSLGYFEFLNSLTEFDCLIVNDAATDGCHEINPYLPSKLSDYLGSGSRIWAVVEDGSILSSLAHDYVTTVGDVQGAIKTLRDLAGLAALMPADGRVANSGPGGLPDAASTVRPTN